MFRTIGKQTSYRKLGQKVVCGNDVAGLREFGCDYPSFVAAIRNQCDQMRIPRIVSNIVDLLLEGAVLRCRPLEVDPSEALLITAADRFNDHSTGHWISTGHSMYFEWLRCVFAVLCGRESKRLAGRTYH